MLSLLCGWGWAVAPLLLICSWLWPRCECYFCTMHRSLRSSARTCMRGASPSKHSSSDDNAVMSHVTMHRHVNKAPATLLYTLRSALGAWRSCGDLDLCKMCTRGGNRGLADQRHTAVWTVFKALRACAPPGTRFAAELSPAVSSAHRPFNVKGLAG